MRDPTFLESTKSNYGADARAAAEKLLTAMNLPDPQPEEFLDGTEANLLFLNRYELILRVGLKIRAPEHDLILRPLAAIDIGKDKYGKELTISLVPGVEGVARSYDDVNKLEKQLAADGIYFWDSQTANCGYVRCKLPGFEQGVPVVVDHGAVKKGSPDVRSAKNAFNGAVLKGFQRQIFEPFTARLAAAWRPGDATPDRLGMKHFLRACAKDIRRKTRSTLCNQWNKNSKDYEYKSDLVAKYAAKYEERLKQRDRNNRTNRVLRNFLLPARYARASACGTPA